MIKAQQLTRNYGETVAVDNVGFEIEHGEIVGLLGHNGAGKTTIMKMITGYVEPSAGEVTVDGLTLAEDLPRIQQKIGYLPENCPLYPDMTVTDYLIFAASLKGLEEDKLNQSIRTSIRKTKLESVATKRISTLSRGYRQRLGVAQAILGSPKIYILDEPTNGLDPSQIQEMRSLIKELAKNATVVLSTHILQEVQATCNRVIIIRAGKVALDSSMEDLSSSKMIEVQVGASDKDQKKVFEDFEFAQLVKTREADQANEFILEVNGEKSLDQVSAELAKHIVENGLNLYSMQPSSRDLETIFGEISEGAEA